MGDVERDQLTHGNVAQLELTRAVLERLTDAQYGEPSSGSLHASVGQHIRHIVDHYMQFFLGLPEWRIDYDRRQRDPECEVNRAAALRKLGELCVLLAQLVAELGPHRVAVRVDTGGETPEADWSESTVKRELLFLQSHDVHHFAVLDVMLRSRGITPPAGFGVAPSTLRYLEGQA